jgi:hypothetical protein
LIYMEVLEGWSAEDVMDVFNRGRAAQACAELLPQTVQVRATEQGVLGSVRLRHVWIVHAPWAVSPAHEMEVLLEATMVGKGLGHLVRPGHLRSVSVNPSDEVRNESVGPRRFSGAHPPAVPLLGVDLLLGLPRGTLCRGRLAWPRCRRSSGLQPDPLRRDEVD